MHTYHLISAKSIQSYYYACIRIIFIIIYVLIEPAGSN